MKKQNVLYLFILFTLLMFLMSVCESLAQGALWGITSSGAGHGGGAIFRTGSDGTGLSVEKNFASWKTGYFPSGSLTLANNGKLYGMTFQGGGELNIGVIFEYDPVTRIFENKINFQEWNGGFPYESKLELTPEGKLYGVTSYGGANSYGVLFEFDPATGTYEKKHDFGGLDGFDPVGGVTYVDGKLFGTTTLGGTENAGVIFEFDLFSNTYERRFDLPNSIGKPTGRLTWANEKLYGITEFGVIFEFDPYTYEYSERANWEQMTLGSLVLADNGNLYGTIRWGGAYGKGMLFEFDPITGNATSKADFQELTSGWDPNGEMMVGTDGKLYGHTNLGGVNGNGVLFQYDPVTEALATKIDFDQTNGAIPVGGPILGSDRKIYGLTMAGGTNDYGTLFQYDPATEVHTREFDFTNATDGAFFLGSLVPAGNGKLYGVGYTGGLYDQGVLFEYDTASGLQRKKFDFHWDIGANPSPALVSDGNGKLYGLTENGGDYGGGVIYEFDVASAIYTIKYFFGSAVPSSLILSNGKLYGTTAREGEYDAGLLFEYDLATNTYTTRFEFDGADNGATPNGGVTLANNGKFYGMTTYGGTGDFGIMYEYDPGTGAVVKKFEFDGTAKGAHPQKSLLLGNDGKLYGLATQGGAFNAGVLFSYDPATNIFNKRCDFNNASVGGKPLSGLTMGRGGKMYGTTSTGAGGNLGSVFEFNPVTNAVSVKSEFSAASGSNHVGNLLFVASPPNVFITSPSDGAIGVARTVTVVSKRVTGATTYTIQLSTQPDFSSGLLEKTGTYSQRFTGLAYGTAYYARVKTNLEPDFGKVTSFTTITAESFAFVVSPKDASVGHKTTVKVASNVVPDATTYTIELNTQSDFNGAPLTMTGSRVQTFTGLQYNTTYYARVKTELTDNWGATRSFTTVDSKDLSYVVAPRDGTVDQKTTVKVGANAIPGASLYTIELNTEPDFSGSAVVMSGSRAQLFTGLQYNTTYYSRVKTEFTEEWGATRTFKTISAENLSYVVVPRDGAVDQNTTIKVSSNTVPGANEYIIELNTEPDFTGTAIVKIGSRTQVFTGLNYGTQYYSRVKTDMSPDWGVSTVFTTRTAESISYIISPADGSVNVNYGLNISAYIVPGASSYTIEANTSPEFTGESVVKTSNARTQSFNLQPGQQYFIRVQTDLSPGSWGPAKTFTTGTPMSLAYVTRPADGSSLISTTVKVSANAISGAASYTIELNSSPAFDGVSFVKSSKSTTISFNGLSEGTTYYTRVSTSLAPGTWGTTTTFTTSGSNSGSFARTAQRPDVAETTEMTNSITEEPIKLYPNPFVETTKVYVSGKSKLPAYVTLIDVTGRQLAQINGTTNEWIEFGGEIEAGIYLVKISTSDRTTALRIIKK